MEIVLWILIVILGLVALYYRSKAKEFESLFELSKEYETTGSVFMPHAQSIGKVDGVTIVSSTDGNKWSQVICLWWRNIGETLIISRAKTIRASQPRQAHCKENSLAQRQATRLL